MSELSHLVRTLRCLSDLGGLHIRAFNIKNKSTSRFITPLRLQSCSPLEREASVLHNLWNFFLLYSPKPQQTRSQKA